MTAYATIERANDRKRSFFISILILKKMHEIHGSFIGLHRLEKGNRLGEKEVVELHLATPGNTTL